MDLNKKKTMTPLEDFDKLILKFLQNELSAEEEKKLTTWRNLNAENEKYLADLLTIWKASEQEADPEKIIFDANQAWEKIKPQQSKTIKLTFFRRMAVAASVVLFISIAYFFFKQAPTPEIAWVEYQTMTGETKDILLPDSSLISLNENSFIRYPEKFIQKNRLIKLKGKAFFSVIRNEKKPFIVQTEKINVKVLGTKFQVDDSENDQTLVAVKEGKVLMYLGGAEKNGLILTAKEKGEYLTKSNELQEEPLVTENIFSWKTNIISFENTPLKTVIDDLQKAYKVKIKIQNTALTNKHFSGRFHSADLSRIFLSLEASLNCKISAHGQEYIIE